MAKKEKQPIDNLEKARQELKDAEFIPFDIKGEDEENYLQAKAFFIEQQDSVEKAIGKIDDAIKDSTKTRDLFIKLLADIKEKDTETDLSHLEKIIENYNSTIKEFENSLEKNEKVLQHIYKIINECFTETIKDKVAYVQENGKIFSKYFVLVLDDLS